MVEYNNAPDTSALLSAVKPDDWFESDENGDHEKMYQYNKSSLNIPTHYGESNTGKTHLMRNIMNIFKRKRGKTEIGKKRSPFLTNKDSSLSDAQLMRSSSLAGGEETSQRDLMLNFSSKDNSKPLPKSPLMTPIQYTWININNRNKISKLDILNNICIPNLNIQVQIDDGAKALKLQKIEPAFANIETNKIHITEVKCEKQEQVKSIDHSTINPCDMIKPINQHTNWMENIEMVQLPEQFKINLSSTDLILTEDCYKSETSSEESEMDIPPPPQNSFVDEMEQSNFVIKEDLTVKLNQLLEALRIVELRESSPQIDDFKATENILCPPLSHVPLNKEQVTSHPEISILLKESNSSSKHSIQQTNSEDYELASSEIESYYTTRSSTWKNPEVTEKGPIRDDKPEETADNISYSQETCFECNSSQHSFGEYFPIEASMEELILELTSNLESDSIGTVSNSEENYPTRTEDSIVKLINNAAEMCPIVKNIPIKKELGKYTEKLASMSQEQCSHNSHEFYSSFHSQQFVYECNETHSQGLPCQQRCTKNCKPFSKQHSSD